MPVNVASVGAESRSPLVSNWSVADDAMVLAGEVPGKKPCGLAVVGMPLRDGWVPPVPLISWPPSRKLPRYQSKPRALELFCEIWANRALMLICGGAMLSTWMACSITSKS